MKLLRAPLLASAIVATLLSSPVWAEEPLKLALDVNTGRLDTAFMCPLALANLHVGDPDSGVVTSSPLIREPKSYFGHGVAVAFRKRDEALAEQCNQALREIKEDGTYDKLMHKYVDYDIRI